MIGSNFEQSGGVWLPAPEARRAERMRDGFNPIGDYQRAVDWHRWGLPYWRH